MIWLSRPTVPAAWLVLALSVLAPATWAAWATGQETAAGQETAGQETAGQETAPAVPAQETDQETDQQTASPTAGDPETPKDPEELRKELMQDPAYQAELKKRLAAYRESRSKLTEAVADQRETFVRYLNREVRTPDARTRFFQQRDIVQQRLDEHYDTALALTGMVGPMEDENNKDALTFLVTMIQHRFEKSIYDRPTLDGATFMINSGIANNSQLKYIWEAAARSAVVEGEFTIAKSIYEFLQKPEVLGDKQFNKTDGALSFHLEEHEKQFTKEKAIREKEAEDGLPRVLLKTTQGDVVLELYLNEAPSTVSHFIQLVEDGFYDGLDFPLVLQDKLALTGDPSGDGLGNSGKFLKDEHQRDDARSGLRGSLLMAKIPQDKSGNFFPDSGSSQFTILLLPMISAAEKQTVFGRVIEGMDAISRLRRVDPNKKKEKNEIVQPPDSIIEATVLNRPKTLPEPVYSGPTKPAAQ